MIDDIDEFYGLDLGKYSELTLRHSPILPCVRNTTTPISFGEPIKPISFMDNYNHPKELNYNSLLLGGEVSD